MGYEKNICFILVPHSSTVCQVFKARAKLYWNESADGVLVIDVAEIFYSSQTVMNDAALWFTEIKHAPAANQQTTFQRFLFL